MTATPKTAAERLIADFYGNDLVAFYNSSVDGTPCVEVKEFNRYRTATVLNLGKSIMKHKRLMNHLRNKAAA